MNNKEKISQLRTKTYLTEEEFEEYKEVLKYLCRVSEDNINNMFLPFTAPRKEKYKGLENCPECPALSRIALKNEIWKKHSETKLLVSNLGRVAKSEKEIPSLEEILPQKEKDCDESGYLVAESATSHFVYRLVAETFKPMQSYSGYACHHIDNNGTHNTPDNLIWLTKSQHTEVHKK